MNWMSLVSIKVYFCIIRFFINFSRNINKVAFKKKILKPCVDAFKDMAKKHLPPTNSTHLSFPQLNR